jgi:hypothetical protein
MVNTLNGNNLPGVSAPAPTCEQDRAPNSLGPPCWSFPQVYPNAFDIAVNTLNGASTPSVDGEILTTRALCIPYVEVVQES